MILQRFYDDQLAQASYLIGCAAAGEALIVDANRDVDQYIRAAEAAGLRIAHVTETHIHADYVSGSRELAYRTGAQLYLSNEGGPDWTYLFAREAGAILLRGGDGFEVGKVWIEAVHTPGHTPEHLSFLVTDRATADLPIGILTGDFVFVGDVGRPDLLERAAKVEGTMIQSARTLFESLRSFRHLPDHLQVWPGHGAGSACGKGISAVPTSTVGYEKLFNWAFSIEDEEEFVHAVLSGQPEAPKYFAEMKRVNREGPRVLGGFARPQRLTDARLPQLLAARRRIVDTRSASDFAAAHLPGTINIPLVHGFTTWAGSLLPYDAEFYLIVNDRCHHCIDEAARDLAMIGLDRVGGYFAADVVESWRERGGQIESLPQFDVNDLDARREEIQVIDVRGRAEWEQGHLPGARNIHLGELMDRLDEIPRDRVVVVHCETGTRSAIAASVLQAEGYERVANLSGGYRAWEAAGYATEVPAGGASAPEPG